MKGVTLVFTIVMFVFYSEVVLSQRSSNKQQEEGVILYFDGTWKNDTYRDSKRSVVYRMEENGRVTDKKGNEIIIVVGHSYRNHKNEMLGRFLQDGDIRDSQGRLLGMINKYGEIRDNTGAYLGELKDLTPQQAAVQYFFWDEMILREKRLRRRSLER